MKNGEISFSLADAAAYRTARASKTMHGFDVIDYGQEDYVFGTSERGARHWDSVLLEIFETYADRLAPLFNSGTAQLRINEEKGKQGPIWTLLPCCRN